MYETPCNPLTRFTLTRGMLSPRAHTSQLRHGLFTHDPRLNRIDVMRDAPASKAAGPFRPTTKATLTFDQRRTVAMMTSWVGAGTATAA